MSCLLGIHELSKGAGGGGGSLILSRGILIDRV